MGSVNISVELSHGRARRYQKRIEECRHIDGRLDNPPDQYSEFTTFFLNSLTKHLGRMKTMGLLGDFAKGLVILAGLGCVYAIVSFAAMGYTEIALLFLATFMIPVVMILHEYWKNRKDSKERGRS